MLGYFIFIFVIIVLLEIASITKNKGFNNLTIRREADVNEVIEGEEFKVTTVIENNKWFPISFLILREIIPRSLEYFCSEGDDEIKDSYSRTNTYSVFGYERVKRTYLLRNMKRGTYVLRDMEVTIGDAFGFSSQTKMMESAIELVVYPKLIDIKNFPLLSTNIQGETIIRRWIYTDPLYIKGIREYNFEDRMKDIHWKSTVKMNKLMVKEYDYTSERELIIIFNVQCTDPHWSGINKNAIERGVKISASFAKKAIAEGIATGMWTNAFLLSYLDECNSEIAPSINSFKNIMNMCARVAYTPRVKFEEYLEGKVKYFNRNCTYVVVTPFLNENSINILTRLKKTGFLMKLIDVSDNGTVPEIEGIQKIDYKGDR